MLTNPILTKRFSSKLLSETIDFTRRSCMPLSRRSDFGREPVQTKRSSRRGSCRQRVATDSKWVSSWSMAAPWCSTRQVRTQPRSSCHKTWSLCHQTKRMWSVRLRATLMYAPRFALTILILDLQRWSTQTPSCPAATTPSHSPALSSQLSYCQDQSQGLTCVGPQTILTWSDKQLEVVKGTRLASISSRSRMALFTTLSLQRRVQTSTTSLCVKARRWFLFCATILSIRSLMRRLQARKL